MDHLNLPRGFAGGLVDWRLYVLHYVAKALGLLVKVEGFPYGSSRNLGYRQADSSPLHVETTGAGGQSFVKTASGLQHSHIEADAALRGFRLWGESKSSAPRSGMTPYTGNDAAALRSQITDADHTKVR